MSMRYPGGLIATSPVNARYPSGVWTQAQAAPYQAQNVWTRDQFWPYTTLLLQGDGAVNGAQNNTFLDSSSNNFTITRNGSTTQGSFTPYEQDGYWSNYLDGSSARLTIGTQAILNVGTGNFTVECFIFFPGRTTTYGRESIIATTEATSSSGVTFRLTGSTQGSTGIAAIVAGTTVSSSTPISANTWHHVAMVRNSGTVTVYVDGLSVASGAASGSINNTASYNIGSLQAIDPLYSDFFQGYISNFRTTNTAVYTSNFTPPVASLTAISGTALLTCQSNRFRDNSTNAFAITVNGSPSVQAFQPFPGATTYSSTLLGGSAFFPNVLTTGSVAYSNFLTLTNAAVNLSGASYTMEAWVCPNQYPSGTPPQELISVFEWYAAFDNRWGLGISSNAVYVYTDGPSAAISASFVVPLNAWTHLAASWDGTTTRLFANGTLLTSNSTNYARNLSTLNIGRSRYSQYGITDLGAFPGYMADMRIVRGSAVYTASFTPPTAPITAVTNTQLLLSCTNAGIYDNSMMNDLETVGNAQVSTSVVKYGTGSMAFDGSGDYLVPSSPATNLSLVLGSGDFTIEMWVYFNGGLGSDIVLYDSRPLSTNGVYPTIYVNSSSQLAYVVSSSDRIVATTAFATGQWYHIAICRSGTSTRMFINGTQTGSTYSDSNNYLNPARRPVIAINGFNETAAPLNGYIDDLRVTRAARYITNFTPPPARMPGQ